MSLRKQKRVLVFYADTGAGHRSVAAAISCAMTNLAAESLAVTGVSGGVCSSHDGMGTCDDGVPFQTAPPWQVQQHNPIVGCDSAFLKRVFSLYAPITRRAPALFAGAYHVTNSYTMCRLLGNVLEGQLRRHLCRVIHSEQPDLVVCVNSLLTYAVLRALRRCESLAPLFVVVTDLTSIHRSWNVPEVKRCFVPTAEARDELIAQGMPAQNIWLSGLPVHPAYSSRPEDSPREALRVSLGLHPDLFTVLIVGGGEGVGRVSAISRELAWSGLPIQLIVVAGRNRTLYNRLEARSGQSGVPCKIYGYAQNMPDLMRASDVIVTKAGSVTIAEALACGLPIVLFSVIGGQETGNVDFIVRNRIGCLARAGKEVVESVRRLLHLDEREREAISWRAFQVSAPWASFEVARQIRDALEVEEQTVDV